MNLKAPETQAVFLLEHDDVLRRPDPGTATIQVGYSRMRPPVGGLLDALRAGTITAISLVALSLVTPTMVIDLGEPRRPAITWSAWDVRRRRKLTLRQASQLALSILLEAEASRARMVEAEAGAEWRLEGLE